MPTCWGGLLYGRVTLGCPLQRGHATLGLHATSRAPAGCKRISMAVAGQRCPGPKVPAIINTSTSEASSGEHRCRADSTSLNAALPPPQTHFAQRQPTEAETMSVQVSLSMGTSYG